MLIVTSLSTKRKLNPVLQIAIGTTNEPVHFGQVLSMRPSPTMRAEQKHYDTSEEKAPKLGKRKPDDRNLLYG